MIKGQSLKVFGIVALGVAAVFGAWQGFAEFQLRSFVFKPIKPGRVNLIAVSPEAGYRVIVSNSIATLAEVPNSGFGATESVEQRESDDGQNKKKLPMREMLQALQGDGPALATLIAVQNDMKPEDLPPDPIVWKSEDIERAIEGDAALLKQLETDLNVRLDGTPLEEVRPSQLENGIVIDHPVTVEVMVEGKPTPVVARVREPYRPSFAARVFDRYAERSDITDALIAGTYAEEARKLLEGKSQKESVKDALRGIYDPERVKELTVRPSQVLGNTEIILNETFMTGVKLESRKVDDERTVYDLRFQVTEEGRKRLWKYSRQNRGFQLLLVVDGVAISAPRITQELVTSDVSVTQLTDGRLAQESVEKIKGLIGSASIRQP